MQGVIQCMEGVASLSLLCPQQCSICTYRLKGKGGNWDFEEGTGVETLVDSSLEFITMVGPILRAVSQPQYN